MGRGRAEANRSEAFLGKRWKCSKIKRKIELLCDYTTKALNGTLMLSLMTCQHDTSPMMLTLITQLSLHRNSTFKSLSALDALEVRPGEFSSTPCYLGISHGGDFSLLSRFCPHSTMFLPLLNSWMFIFSYFRIWSNIPLFILLLK